MKNNKYTYDEEVFVIMIRKNLFFGILKVIKKWYYDRWQKACCKPVFFRG
jgi:hypothetical protein